MGPSGMKDASKPRRAKLVVLAGLAIIAAAMCFRALASGPQSAPAAALPTPDAPPAPGERPASVSRETIAWPPATKRDPFQSALVYPPTPVAKVEPKIEAPVITPPVVVDIAALARQVIDLKGTILGERPIAMMNGRVYRVGEVVEGFHIVEIGKHRVTVERDGAQVVIDAK